MFTKQISVRGAIAALLLLGANTVWAAGTCSFTVEPGDVDFGDYVLGEATNLTSQSSMIVLCGFDVLDPASATVTYTVKLSSGSTRGNESFNLGLDRKMAKVSLPASSDTLTYNLYLSVANRTAQTPVWGDGDNGTVFHQNTITKGVGVILPDVINIYGLLPGSQTVQAGSYRDTVTATLDF